jgi:hypothetical protein
VKIQIQKAMDSSKTNTCGVEDKLNTDSTDQDNKRYKWVKKEHNKKIWARAPVAHPAIRTRLQDEKKRRKN